MICENDLKFSIVPKQELLLALDRLTRFKTPQIKYYRVFSDLITKYLIEPKLSKKEIYSLPIFRLKNIVETIWNSSVRSHLLSVSDDFSINLLLEDEIKNTYIIDSDVEDLIRININIKDVTSFVTEYDSSPVNIKRLIKLCCEYEDNNFLRQKYALRFPLEKVILCEGITEEILLPQFAKLSGFDFDKEGVRLVGAGGKNQVAKLYYQLKNELKIPIFILLDADAEETKLSIEKVLRSIDNVYLIKRGEFEDIFSINLIKRTINNRFKNICECHVVDFKQDAPMTKILAEFYRVHELGDFQKADFAKELACNLRYQTDLTEEIIEIINEIKQ